MFTSSVFYNRNQPFEEAEIKLLRGHDKDKESEAETNGNTRSNTPRRVASVARLAPEPIKVASAVEIFPEFPPAPTEYDANAYFDETMSIAASIEDESTIDFEMTVEDDLYPTADLAEEAAGIDDEIINDRMYKALMAKNGNTLNAEITNIVAAVNVFNKNARVLGKADTIGLTYQLNVLRQIVYENMKIKQCMEPIPPAANPQMAFEVNAPANSLTSFVNLSVNQLTARLDDEIVSHLAAFALDEQVVDNKVRLGIAVQNSDIEIKDRKKKKPMRIRIRDIVIEQDEDARTDSED